MSDQEKDYLVYTGNKVPRVIRLVWTAIILFGAYYLMVYAWPDLKEWMTKIK